MSAPAPADAASSASAAPAADAAAASSSSAPAEEVTTIADAGVVSKYKEAASIAADALGSVVRSAAAGVAVLHLAKLGDDIILERTAKVHTNKKGITKGVAFPTSISVNNVVGHYAPLEKDAEQPLLKEGDIVKVDLGVHIDGYAAVVAQTFAVPAAPGNAQATPIKGRAADAYAACLVAADAALKSLRPGAKNTSISELISKIAAEYKVTPVQGVLSHVMPRHKLDGDKAIVNRLDPEQKIEECTVGENEVWGIDIVMSTGEGKPKEVDNRQTTIYKRDPKVTYSLKSQTARTIYGEMLQKYASFPFSLRYLTDANKARFGMAEIKEHNLVHSYPVLHEREGECVAQLKFTALVGPAGTTRITGPVGGFELNPHIVQVEKRFKDYDAELQTALKALNLAATPAAAAAAGGEGGAAAASSSNAAKNAKKRAAQAKKKAAEAAAAGAESK